MRRLQTRFGGRLFDDISSTLDAIQATPVGRRRVIVIFSDGEDTGSRTSLRHLMDRARALNVMVYGIGLMTRFDDDDDIVSSRPDRTLMPLARVTGGGYYEPDNRSELERIVARIEEELRHQYVLTFSPVSGAGSHRIHVLATQPNLKVRTRDRLIAMR